MDDEEPPELDASTAEPPTFGEARDSILTPEGQIQSLGDFSRGLGPRVIKIAFFAFGGLLLVFALFAALS